jgi:hypothetical protein
MSAKHLARRTFLKHSAASIGGLVTAVTLKSLTGYSRVGGAHKPLSTDYGELAPVEDQNGGAILALPRGVP